MRTIGKYESSISSARATSKSLRTTIPEGVVNPLGLKRSDKLIWEVVFDEDKREIFAIVRKK
jgi:bifunctional DNA-binding transcriptional regulator/antitoxin component of YhaV-PrlF toxin-antitoxin module